MRPRRRGEGMKRAETPRSPGLILGPKTQALAGKTLRITANPRKADDGPRTRDLRLGKPTLYQLSYVRAGAILAPI
jgi:hypothetical protein